LLLLTKTVFAQNTGEKWNDNFADAYVIFHSGNFTTNTFVQIETNKTGLHGNQNATREPGEPSHSPDPSRMGNHTVWWVWTPSVTSGVRMYTDSNFDTQIGVYTGSTVSTLTPAPGLSVNDESARGRDAEVAFEVVAGTTYHIAVSGATNDHGVFNLHLGFGAVPPSVTNNAGLQLTVRRIFGSGASGSVTKGPDKLSYSTNEAVTLTASPSSGSRFTGWGGDAAAFGTNNPITITMNTHKSVSASFTTNSPPPADPPKIVQLSVTINAEGLPKLVFRGAPGTTVRIEASSDLAVWQNISTIVFDHTGTTEFIDTSGSTNASRFYRTVSP
jgi:hypothetical protein